MQRLERVERMMKRWMCGVTTKDRNSSEELRERLGIVSVSDIVRQGRLRWFGHVERKETDDWVTACRNLEVEGKRGRGRGKKTWKECVANDMKKLMLKQEDAQDRAVWHFGEPSNPSKRDQTDANTVMMMLASLEKC